MAIQEKRIRCKGCGERVAVVRGERGPAPQYCDLCRDERRREQTRLRVQAYRSTRQDRSEPTAG